MNGIEIHFKQLSQFIRTQIITLDKKQELLKNLNEPDFKGTFTEEMPRIHYRNLLDETTIKSLICKEVLMTVPSVIYAPKDFYLVAALNEEIFKLHAAGFIQFWESKMFDRNLENSKFKKRPEVLTMMHFTGAFQILSVGLIVGATVFIVECLQNLFSRLK